MGDRWAGVREWVTGHPSEFRLGLRILIAGMAAFFVADVVLGLPQSYWAVLTAVIVMQASLGGALKASVDRIVGTIAGALWGVIVALIVPHGGSWLLATALTLGVGSLVGLAVALLVLPARAHRLLADQAATVLDILALQIGQLPARLAGTADAAYWQQTADRRRKAQDKAETLAEEAKHERRNRLTDTPDPEPLARTLRRLGVDVAQFRRASAEAWDAILVERLSEPLGAVVETTAQFLRACGGALIQRAAPPSIGPVAAALERLSAIVAILRQDGTTRPLPGPTMERLFGLGFALDQMRRDAEDLAERVAELAPAAEEPDGSGVSDPEPRGDA